MKIAGIYARVSTDQQEKEETIQSQLEALRQYARERDYLVDPQHEYVDTFTGGRLDRPGLERLRDDISEGKLEAVLVYCPDRLARQFAYQVVLLEEFQRRGVEVVFLNRPYSDRPEDQMLLQVQGVFAEFEKKMIAERTRRGRLHAARHQGRVPCGRRPYGYVQIRKSEGARGGELRIVESEAEVVRRIFHGYAEEGLSLGGLSRRLVEYGIRSPGGSSAWGLPTLGRLLSNPVYKGLRYYNVVQTTHKEISRPRLGQGLKSLPRLGLSRAKRPKEEWIPVSAPAILDEGLWDAVQKRLQENVRFAPRHNTVKTYLLRSLLICGRCGRRLVGTYFAHHRGRPPYYHCPGQYPARRPNRCEGTWVRSEEVERVVWKSVRTLLASPEVILRQYARLEGEVRDETVEAREQKRLSARTRALEREEQRLMDAYQQGAIELDDLKERRERIRQHLKLAEDRLAEIESRLAEQKKQIRLVQGLQDFCSQIHEALEHPTLEQKVKILRLVLDGVILRDGHMTLRHVIPIGDVFLPTDNRSKRKVGLR